MKITSEKLIVVLGRVIDAIGSLVFLKMLASFVSKNDVGMYMLASSYLAILLTVSFSALDQGLLRNVTEYRQQDSLASRYSAMLAAYGVSAATLALLCATTIMTLVPDSTFGPLWIPMTLWLTAETLKNLNMNVASGCRLRSLVAGASALDYGCRLALLWWIAHAGGLVSTTDIVYLLAAAGAATCLLYVWGQRALLARFSWFTVGSTLQDSIRFSWPMIIWGCFGWLQNMSNRWLLHSFASLPVVAEYGVLVAIGTFPVTALLGLVVTYAVPILYERESAVKGSSRAIVLRVASALLPVCGAMVAATAFWHHELVLAFSGADYTAHSQVLPVVMAAACASAICSVLTYAVYAQRRVASLLLANTLPGAFSLAFGYFAVSQYQFNGAILTLVLGHLIAALLYVVTYLVAGRRRDAR